MHKCLPPAKVSFFLHRIEGTAYTAPGASGRVVVMGHGVLVPRVDAGAEVELGALDGVRLELLGTMYIWLIVIIGEIERVLRVQMPSN